METLARLSEEVGAVLLSKKKVLVTAESCTGGGIATAITDIAGSSAWFDRAFVTYSNEAKMEMLGVSSETLSAFGAVSEPVVKEMVQGSLHHSNGTVAIAVSGIAGPSGGSVEKPVGTVCFAWMDLSGWLKIETCHFNGERAEVRRKAIHHALKELQKHFIDEQVSE